MKQSYIDFPEEVHRATKMLPNDERGAVIVALIEYGFYGNEPTSLKSEMQKAIYLAAKRAIVRHDPKPSKPSKRKQLSGKHRMMILERDNFTCQYCGRSAPEVVLEVDHIVPASKGGTNDKRNLITACRECNNAKRDHIIGESRKW